jgi:hypothetical protein
MEAITMTSPVADIGHNSGATRKALYIAEITKAMEARKAKRLEEALSARELGALTSSDRIIALKHGLLDNYRVIYAMYPNLDVLPGVVLFVSIFSDHGGQYDSNGRCTIPPGCCTYSMAKMACFFSRSVEAIRGGLKRAVACGALQREMKPKKGGKYLHSPVVFKGILDPSSSATYFVDASLPGEDTPSQLGVRLPAASEASLGGHSKPSLGDHPKPDGGIYPREHPREYPKGSEPPRPELSIASGSPNRPATESRARPSRKRSAKARTRLPDDWKPAPAVVTWVRENFLASDRQIADQAEKFRAYHTSRGSTMADWEAAWRNWWLNDYHKIPRRPSALADRFEGQPGTGSRSALEEAIERARRADEENRKC